MYCKKCGKELRDDGQFCWNCGNKIEIKEEVGLSSREIELVRSGKPLHIYDEQEETVWIVYPFLFSATSQRVITDWEHSDRLGCEQDPLLHRVK